MCSSISKASVFDPEKPVKVFSWTLCGWHHSDPAVTARMKGLTNSVTGSVTDSVSSTTASATSRSSKATMSTMELDPDACPDAETWEEGLGGLVDGIVEDDSDSGDGGDVGDVGEAAGERGGGEGVVVMPGRGGGKGEGKVEGGKGEKRRCKLL